MSKDIKSVSVYGLGYIGLPTASLIASKGFEVIGVDNNEKIVEGINLGNVHIFEPGLDDIVREAVSNGNLSASSEPVISDVHIMCVPTPFLKISDDPSPDLSYVFDALKAIISVIKAGDLLIIESTCPVGTTIKIREEMIKEGIDADSIHIAYCPERVLPGNILSELVSNDRIVGSLRSESNKHFVEFYRTFVEGDILTTDSKTAELSKLTENSFRDVNIAIANELSMISDNFDIDVRELIDLANHHPRVNILSPGSGVGGHCIAVDPWFIVSGDNINTRLIRTAREINDYKPSWVVGKVLESIEDNGLKNPLITCFGLSFKPNIDDLRESPSLVVFNELKKRGLRVNAVEPNISKAEGIELVSYQDALSSDIVLMLVSHDGFQEFLRENKDNLNIIMDFCGLLHNASSAH